MTLSITLSTTTPHANQTVFVTVDAADPDAVPACAVGTIGSTRVLFRDSSTRRVPVCPMSCPASRTRYGPWTPPAPSGATVRLKGAFSATGRGAQQLVVVADSGHACPYLAYGSNATGSTTITVG
jgi:hypothetical protein